jgi:hypothetical protein
VLLAPVPVAPPNPKLGVVAGAGVKLKGVAPNRPALEAGVDENRLVPVEKPPNAGKGVGEGEGRGAAAPPKPKAGFEAAAEAEPKKDGVDEAPNNGLGVVEGAENEGMDVPEVPPKPNPTVGVGAEAAWKGDDAPNADADDAGAPKNPVLGAAVDAAPKARPDDG